jgi:hypothetical protein
MEQSIRHEPDIYERFFGVVTRPQTYQNLVFHALGFPLGLTYFILLVVGLSLGISLAIIWVGLLILLLMLAIWWGLIIFERELAVRLLSVNIPPLNRPYASQQSMFGKLRLHLSDSVTWKGLLYLFLRFPMGLVSFVALVTWGSLTFGLIAAPFLYARVPLNVGMSRIGSMNEAMFAAFIGVMIGFAGLHLLNWMAVAWGWMAQLLLSSTPRPVAAAAVMETAPVVTTPAVVITETAGSESKPAPRKRARKAKAE